MPCNNNSLASTGGFNACAFNSNTRCRCSCCCCCSFVLSENDCTCRYLLWRIDTQQFHLSSISLSRSQFTSCRRSGRRDSRCCCRAVALEEVDEVKRQPDSMGLAPKSSLSWSSAWNSRRRRNFLLHLYISWCLLPPPIYVLSALRSAYNIIMDPVSYNCHKLYGDKIIASPKWRNSKSFYCGPSSSAGSWEVLRAWKCSCF